MKFLTTNLLLVLVGLSLGLSISAQDQPVEKQPTGKLVQYVDVGGDLIKEDGVYETTLKLGRLNVANKVVITMRLKNPLDEEIKFSDVSKKCSCSAFQAKDYVIPGGGEQAVRLTIKTPARSRTAVATQKITFVEDGQAVVRAKLEFELDGLLAFEDPFGFVEFETSDEKKELAVPFLVTPPVQVENLEVKASEKLPGVTFDIQKTETGGVLKATFPDSVLVDGKVRGEIHLSDPQQQTKDSFFVVVKDLATDEISPTILSFREIDGVMSATAIVKLSSRQQEQVEDPIQCKFANRVVPAELKQLKKNTYRVKLTLDKELVGLMAGDSGDGSSKKIQWVINSGKKKPSYRTTAFVIGSGS